MATVVYIHYTLEKAITLKRILLLPLLMIALTLPVPCYLESFNHTLNPLKHELMEEESEISPLASNFRSVVSVLLFCFLTHYVHVLYHTKGLAVGL